MKILFQQILQLLFQMLDYMSLEFWSPMFTWHGCVLFVED